MANEVTIDSIQIEIEAESASAASNLDALAQSIDRLQAATQRITTGNNGLRNLERQIERLNRISGQIRSLRGFERIGQIAEQFRPLESLNASGLSAFTRSLNRLSGVDLSRLESQIRQISTAIEPLVRQAERGGAGLTALAQIMQSTNRQAQRNTSGFGLFNQTIGNIKVKTLAAIAGLRRLFSMLKSGVTASAAYVENLNLFNVTMGKSASSALEFAEAVNSALGVDTSDWIRYQGVFQSIAKGFGIVSEKADVMSKNLTQLTYDISSFYNISVDTAGEKLQSALSGQVMPMRQLGFAIEETTLKQVALNHGIEMSVENMTQAQKAQLRYVAIMEQAGNIGVLGDMARTIDTAANGMRVLQARMQQFARAIGNMVMPVLSAVLPYLTAFVQVLTEGAQAIANFFGFELPKIDFSGASVSSGYDDITASVDEATKATEKFKGTLSSVDQLNIIGSHNESGNGDNANQYDLGIELPEYDFLQGVESKTKQIAENIKGWFKEALPWIEAVGAAIGTVFIASKINSFLGILGKVRDTFSVIGMMVKGDFGKGAQIFSGVVGGLAAGASSGILFYNSIKNLITGTGNATHNWVKFGGAVAIAGGAIAAFIALGNPLGAVITGIVAGVGALVGVMQGFAEKTDKANQAVMDSFLYNNGGTKISVVADAFENWASAAKKVNDEVINKYAKLDEYDTKMGELRDTMTEIAGVDLKLDEITSADAAALKEPFDELVTYLKTNFKEETTLAAQSVADAFKNLNIGGEISAEVSAAYKKLQRDLDDTMTASQKVVDDYLDKMAGGTELTSAEMKELQGRLELTTKLSMQGDVSTLEKVLDEIDMSKIDIENPEYGIESLDKIKSAAEEYAQSIESRYKVETDNLDRIRETLKILRDTPIEYGGITEEEYRNKLGLIEFSKSTLALNYNQQMIDVQKKINSITSPIFRELYEGSQEIESGWESWLAALFHGDLGNQQDYAISMYLDDSELYGKLQEIDQFAAHGLKTNIEVNTTFSSESAAALALTAIKGKFPDIELEIGRIQDESGQLKYIVGDRQSLIDAKIPYIKSDDGNWQILTGEKTAVIKAMAMVSMEEWYKPLSTSSPTGPYMLEQIDVKSQYDWAYKAGEWIEKGFQDGLSETQYRAYWEELADIGAKTFCEKYGIHSPSTLFRSYGEYIMQGLANGITAEQKTVLSSLDSTVNVMERRMSGIGLSVPVAADNSRLKAAVDKAQESLARAQNISFDADFSGYSAHRLSLPKLSETDSHTTWKSDSANSSPGEMEATITIYNQLDVDGETIAEKVNDINARLLYRSNGR